jgi:hypothetical protein
MKYKLLSIASAICLFAGTASTEQDKALRYLTDSRQGVVDAVKGLSAAQWNYKPAPDRWSVAEVLEHITVTEGFITGNVLAHFSEAPAGAPDRDVKKTDAMVMARMPDRSVKAQAPPPLHPTGKWTPEVTLEHFLAARRGTIDFLKSTPDLRQHVVNNPAFGPLDGYEWILFAAAHSERHTKQILEVKADPGFPK